MAYIWLIVAFFIYSILPTSLIRIFSFRVQKKVKNGVALTFDDGPDPVYTPQLLDLLKKYNVKATFFVVGWKAKKYPHLIKRMYEEGHTIGLHHYYHTSNWFLPPFFTQWELERSTRIIEQITGVSPVYYRPPWGHISIWTLFTQKKYKIVMWTYILGDWKATLGVDRLYKRLMSSIEDGAIIVLHDSGSTFGADEHAPANMLQALDRLLQYTDVKWVKLSEE
ncbi:polysaccharide deacetylase family protein [Anoxybacillus flavithermus]|uniref:Polysaccharide deacetylase family protein n=1 Tax=Anoxybacillus flavithermus TaxID=33934 RepID=A0A2G5RNR3_9BACL|nr:MULTISPECIES: polysaccharide deacetylase family protein [Anoxybacillus]KFZ43004.1 polysaccharide deacetylase [Anoxybacillus sp. KU2-6(11)]PIC04444.1 polysaccharide deacetylase family protein [Anoxybacillus flavithermus]